VTTAGGPQSELPLLLSLSPLTTGGASTEDDIALCHHAGLERIGVSMAKLAAGGRDAIAASGLAVDVVYPAVGLDLRAPASWEAARAGMLAAVDTGAALGASAVLLPAGAAGGLLWEDAVAALDTAMAPVIAAVDGSGVRLLLEPVRPQFAYASFVHTFRDGVVLARRFGVGLVFDVTHCWWEPGLAELIAGAVDLIGTVHLADLALDRPVISRLVPGDGALPLAPILGLLQQSGYLGPYELELIGPAIDEEGPQGAVRRAITHLNSLRTLNA
jgi:sugar phosphate isomerase/epimerase